MSTLELIQSYLNLFRIYVSHFAVYVIFVTSARDQVTRKEMADMNAKYFKVNLIKFKSAPISVQQKESILSVRY